MEVFLIPKNEHLINEQIRDSQVRLIDENGEQKGIVPIAEALEAAEAASMDLVMISPNADPPVCRLMDYGKYKFEQSKRQREARKNQNVIEVKEIKLSVGIGDHDYEFKLRNAHKFLDEGDKVKVSVRFKGRGITHPDLGRDIIMRFVEDCAEKGTMEKQPKLDGRIMSLVIASKTAKQ